MAKWTKFSFLTQKPDKQVRLFPFTSFFGLFEHGQFFNLGPHNSSLVPFFLFDQQVLGIADEIQVGFGLG